MAGQRALFAAAPELPMAPAARAERQASLFADAAPSAEELAALARLEKTMGIVTRTLVGGFAPDDLVTLRSVHPLRASVLREELRLIEREMQKLRAVLGGV